jgi:hypothetical protein
MSKIYTREESKEQLRQGEFITGIVQPSVKSFVVVGEKNINAEISRVEHKYSVIISQDCDLQKDFNCLNTSPEGENFTNRLNAVLICPIIEAEILRSRAGIISSQWSKIKTNQEPRYHFFEAIPEEVDLLDEGLPELTADFKHVFGLHSDYLYWLIKDRTAFRRTKLVSPYLEHFIQRFYFYQSRIALPEHHKSEPIVKSN